MQKERVRIKEILPTQDNYTKINRYLLALLHLDSAMNNMLTLMCEEYLQNRCCEEKWADRLLNGGHIVCKDWYAAEDDEEGKPTRYKIDLNTLKEGLELAALAGIEYVIEN